MVQEVLVMHTIIIILKWKVVSINNNLKLNIYTNLKTDQNDQINKTINEWVIKEENKNKSKQKLSIRQKI